MKKHRKLKIFLIVIAVIIALMAGGTAVYVNDYYHADASAQAAVDTPAENVTVTKGSGDALYFAPSAENDRHIGLIFYPGGKVEYTAYAPLMSDLAQRGITCILLKVTWNLAIMDVNAADGIKEQFPEIKEWYMGGHSLGGAVSAMYLQKHPGEYNGLIFLGAYSSVDLTESGLRVLSIYGENDGVLNREKYEEGRANLPEDFTEYVIPGGCHAWFGSYGEQNGDGTATITAKEQQMITADTISEWISR